MFLYKFYLESDRWPWKKGRRVKLILSVDSLPMISYLMSLQTKPVSLIFKELSSIFYISENGGHSAILKLFKDLKMLGII